MTHSQFAPADWPARLKFCPTKNDFNMARVPLGTTGISDCGRVDRAAWAKAPVVAASSVGGDWAVGPASIGDQSRPDRPGFRAPWWSAEWARVQQRHCLVAHLNARWALIPSVRGSCFRIQRRQRRSATHADGATNL